MYPKTIDIAIKVFFIAILVGVISSYFNIANAPANLSKTAMTIFSVILFSLYGLLFLFISKRKNWARFVWVILYIGGLAMTFSASESITYNHVAVEYLYYVQTLLQAVLTILLFSPTSNAWFKNV